MDSLKAQSHGSNQGQRWLSRADRPLVYPNFPLSSVQTSVCMEFISQPDIRTNVVLSSSILASLKHARAVRIPACFLTKICHQIWDKGLRRYLISKTTNSQLSPHTTAVCHGFVLQLLPFSSVLWRSAALWLCHWISCLNHIRIFIFAGIYKEKIKKM